MQKIAEAVGWVVLALVAIVILTALPTKWLWNWLMPDLFGLTHITFWQALGINLLCGILFRVSGSSSKKS